MATRADETAKSKKTERAVPAKKVPASKAPAARKAPRKAAPRKAVPRKGEPAAGKTQAAPPGKAEGLLRAGLKALDTVRNDVAKRQANVIEGLLGIRQGKVPSLDSFGIRKFEDVFDQRVATALERLGLPNAQEVQALRDEVAQLRERVAQLEGSAGSAAAAASPRAAASRGRARR